MVTEWCEINLIVMEFVMKLGVEFGFSSVMTMELYSVFELSFSILLDNDV